MTTSREYLVQQMKEYLKTHRVQVHILTPCYGGVVFVNYTNCLIQTYNVLNSLGVIVSSTLMSNESLITRARNSLIATSMNCPEMTHVLFIDADITWDPYDIIKLIVSDKELIGGIYPFKHYFLEWMNEEFKEKIEKLHSKDHNKHIDNVKFLQQNLLKYNLNYKKGLTTVPIENNCIEIDGLATGFMLIKRSCIEKMMDQYPQTKYTSDGDFIKDDENKWLYALFDCYIKDDRYLSEDWAFCDRWRSIGGKVFADLTIQLSHTGHTHYPGRILSTLDI